MTKLMQSPGIEPGSTAWQAAIIPLNQDCSQLRQPGIEPGSLAWKAGMLTIIPLTLVKVPKICY